MSPLITEADAPAPALPNPKWIRGELDGQTVIDSRNSLFVWEVPYYPQWYFPRDDVVAELRPTGEVRPTGNRGDAVVHDLAIGARVIAAGALRHPHAPTPEIRDLVRIEWWALDRWLEEDVEVTVHPRSPYTRIDVLPSSRHVVVRVDGTVVADSRRPSILYETGLPPRYYLPPEDVRSDLLIPTGTTSACPYKGVARYWSVAVDGHEHPDLVWGYDDPLPESSGVAKLLCFYNERIDLEVDGAPIDRPTTKFS